MPQSNDFLPTVKVLIADDHTLIIASVKNLISRRDDVKHVHTAKDGVTAIALAKEVQPDLLILDLALPYASGIEILAEVRRWSKATRTLVLTGLTSPAVLRSALNIGACGIALKSTPLESLAHGIDAVLNGETWLSADVALILEAEESKERLTTRETQILSMIVRGMTNAEIADQLGISPKTVDNHRTRLMAKLRVNSRAQLLAEALKSGLLDAQL